MTIKQKEYYRAIDILIQFKKYLKEIGIFEDCRRNLSSIDSIISKKNTTII